MLMLAMLTSMGPTTLPVTPLIICVELSEYTEPVRSPSIPAVTDSVLPTFTVVKLAVPVELILKL